MLAAAWKPRMGFSVRCVTGLLYCSYFRPGPKRRGGPLVTTADFQLWGLGVRGLRFRSRIRAGADLGDSNTWPGTSPTMQLLEGYAEYSTRVATAQIGRTYAVTRLGFTGFDGARVDVRSLGRRLTASAYGGWGLSRGVALPLTSPALNPLDDATPQRRQGVTGATLGWRSATLSAQAVYEREWAGSDAIISQRVGAEASFNPGLGISLAAGADYDIAAGFWGSTDFQVSYSTDRFARLTAGVRSYRPHFDLWTIWGAFNPVPYRSVYGRGRVSPFAGLEIRGRAEFYEFDDADALTPLVTVETGGWRWSAGSTYDLSNELTLSADYHREVGPGAASRGISGNVQLEPVDQFSASFFAGRLERPLEFRFNDAQVWMFGTSLDFEPFRGVRVTANLRRYDERRDRPDAAAFDWEQFRFSLGASVYFGSHIATSHVPPAVLRVPMRSQRK